ncbi:MAG TPA: MFS transporter [Candidatus Bathyarchaeia archaeon]|nr:MFS transporter [Candidatus Bathyarchaeia archaeon]
MKRLLWVSCSFYLLIGVTSVVAGALLPELLSYYKRDYSDGGTLLFAQFIGFLAGVLASPEGNRAIGRKNMLLIVLGLLAISYATFGNLPPWYGVVAIAMVTGLCSGAIEAAIGSMIIDTVKENTAVAMSRLEVFFGLGALSMPAVVSLLIVYDKWQLALYMIAAFSVVLMLVWFRMDLSVVTQQENAGHQEPGNGPKLPYDREDMPIVGTFILFFFLYVGVEMSIANYMPSIFIELSRIDSSVASLSVTFFWGAMTMGRLFAGRIAQRVGYTSYLLWSCLLSLLMLTGLTLVTDIRYAFILIVLLGLSMAGIFAIALLLANRLLPGRTERTTSLLIASAGIGGACLSYLTGLGMEVLSVAKTMWGLVGFTLIMLLTMSFLSRHKKRKQQQEQIDLV